MAEIEVYLVYQFEQLSRKESRGFYGLMHVACVEAFLPDSYTGWQAVNKIKIKYSHKLPRPLRRCEWCSRFLREKMTTAMLSPL